MSTKNRAVKKLVVSEICLKYQPRQKQSERMQVSSSIDANNAFMEAWDLDAICLKESFKVAYLDRGNMLLGITHHSEGGITGTCVDIRLIVATALKANSTSMLLAHNHPSGRLKPSQADHILTKRIINAANYFDIKVLDHLILTDDSYFSMGDEGLMGTLKNQLQIVDRELIYSSESMS